MSDHPPSQNPFIRFKQHIDSKVSSGIAFITGTGPSQTTLQHRHEHNQPQHQQEHQQKHTDPSDMFFGGPPFGGDRPFGHMRVQFWNEWAQVSAYSPYNLRHLPQPVPSDLPAGVAAKSFGFEDAFEDLLAASAGRQMMDLSRQARLKKDILDRFGFNEPPIMWTQRLNRDGLLPRPLPFGRPGCGSGWMDRDNEGLGSFEAGLKELDNMFSGMSRSLDIDKSWSRDWEAFKKEHGDNRAGFVEQEWKKVEEGASKVIDNATKKWTSGHQQPQQEQQASSETDLFDFIKSTVAEADKTFNNFTKVFMDIPRKLEENATATVVAAPQANQDAKNRKTTRTEEFDESGGKTIRSESQWVDPAGYLHSDVEVVRMDANGRVTGQENRSHVTFASQSQTSSHDEGFDARVATSTSTSVEHHSSSSSSDDGKSTTGWFWK